MVVGRINKVTHIEHPKFYHFPGLASMGILLVSNRYDSWREAFMRQEVTEDQWLEGFLWVDLETALEV